MRGFKVKIREVLSFPARAFIAYLMGTVSLFVRVMHGIMLIDM